MRPQVGAGGGGPSPRYDSVDSANRFWANASAATTITTPAMLGSTWRTTMRAGLAPSARAAITISLRASTRALPRTTRAIVVQPTAPSVRNTGALDDGWD